MLDSARGAPIGLLEIKAPVYKLYGESDPSTIRGVPLRYICQMHMQMAVTGIKTWCDFAAMCMSTKKLMIKRVYFSESFWSKLEAQIWRFVCCIRDGRTPHHMRPECPPPDLDQSSIVIHDLLTYNLAMTRVMGPRGVWMDFGFLIGTPFEY